MFTLESPGVLTQMNFRLHSASPKAAEAARLLLSDMWSSKELQGVLRQVRATPETPVGKAFPHLLGTDSDPCGLGGADGRA